MSLSEHLNSRGLRDLIKTINARTLIVQAAVDMEREMEIVGGEVNENRKNMLYYPSAKVLQEAEDSLLAAGSPESSKLVESQFGAPSARWNTTVEVASDLRHQLKEAGAAPAIIDCRAKSNFSIVSKLSRYYIDLDEIFDIFGIRIVAWDTDDAYKARDILLTLYDLMRPYSFKRLQKQHIPIRDTLAVPNQSGYSAIHMNLNTNRGIIEAQITTRKAFIDMHRKPNLPGQTILAYK